MKLEKFIICNFRGIGFVEIDINDFIIFVGLNNIGKLIILNVIYLVFDNKKLKLEDWFG